MQANLNQGIVRVLSGRLINGAYLCVVDFTKLFFPDYQRGAITKHVQSIADNWKPAYARPVLVSRREGRLNAFDGRQTSTAAIKRGITQGLAFVWTGWTYEMEAAAFYVFNDVPKQMNGWKKFMAALKGGNATNQLILDTIHNAGLTTPFHPEVVHVNAADVTKSNVVNDVMKKGGLPLLKLFVKVMKGWKIEGVLPDTAKRTDFGRGLREFLFHNQHDAANVVRRLKLVTPDQIRQLANTMPSRGRIDSNQIRQALESATGMGNVLAFPARRGRGRVA